MGISSISRRFALGIGCSSSHFSGSRSCSREWSHSRSCTGAWHRQWRTVGGGVGWCACKSICASVRVGGWVGGGAVCVHAGVGHGVLCACLFARARVCVCMYGCVSMYLGVCVCVWVCLCMHACVHLCVCARGYVCGVRVRACVQAQECVRVCSWVYGIKDATN